LPPDQRELQQKISAESQQGGVQVRYQRYQILQLFREFDVFITVDKNLSYQQNLAKVKGTARPLPRHTSALHGKRSA
jgi:hypothetical protein